jgi:hypothetical protein
MRYLINIAIFRPLESVSGVNSKWLQVTGYQYHVYRFYCLMDDSCYKRIQIACEVPVEERSCINNLLLE